MSFFFFNSLPFFFSLVPVTGYSILWSGPRDAIIPFLMAVATWPDLGVALLQQTTRLLLPAALAFLACQMINLLLWGASTHSQPSDEPRCDARWEGPGKVLLFPGQTSHSRFFPSRHTFTYSYLVVGIPVGWDGCVGGMVSAGSGDEERRLSSWFSLEQKAWFSSRARGWYHVNADDYLLRGKARLGLRGKLNEFLKSQRVNPAQYPHAYLVTAARFLGYQFNPVSFWYLYDANKELAAVILEVNNTFDERRIYLLTPDDEHKTGSGPSQSRHHDGTAVFNQVWPKDFHVSPFNSRKGSYKLVAKDPFRPLEHGDEPLDMTILLKSSKGHAKLLATLVSDGSAVDPSNMGTIAKIKFIASWWWVGLATFPRILKQAAVLFWRHKLHVWFVPMPRKESVARHADSTERDLESIFRCYLRHMVSQLKNVPFSLKYTSAGLEDETTKTFLSPPAKRIVQDAQRRYHAALFGSPMTPISAPSTPALSRFPSTSTLSTTSSRPTTPTSVGPHPMTSMPMTPPVMETLELKVLTPEFYSRFVQYTDDSQAFLSEALDSRTLRASCPDLLRMLTLRGDSLPSTSHSADVEYVDPTDRFYFKLIGFLRRGKAPRIERPMTSTATLRKTEGGLDDEDSRSAPASKGEEEKIAVALKATRKSHRSAMDHYVLKYETAAARQTYRRRILSFLVADRFAFGSPTILEMLRLGVQAYLTATTLFLTGRMLEKGAGYIGAILTG